MYRFLLSRFFCVDFVHLTVIHHSARRFQFGSTVCECSHKKTETLKDGSGPQSTPTIPEFRSAGRRLQSEDYFLFAQGAPFHPKTHLGVLQPFNLHNPFTSPRIGSGRPYKGVYSSPLQPNDTDV
ncbi:hypothetical protein J6590_027187 [Homalodisca vitripennis]|nr:hypothetical protein J6590_027187 [Homalodisca vitripennis]